VLAYRPDLRERMPLAPDPGPGGHILSPYPSPDRATHLLADAPTLVLLTLGGPRSVATALADPRLAPYRVEAQRHLGGWTVCTLTRAGAPVVPG